MIDFVTRLAQQFTIQGYSSKEKVGTYMGLFLEKYVCAVAAKSKVAEHRSTIRASRKLNELLLDNRKGLTQVYNEIKLLEHGGRAGFTVECARSFFMALSG